MANEASLTCQLLISCSEAQELKTLQFIKFLVILPFTFQLSLHLERGTHHAY